MNIFTRFHKDQTKNVDFLLNVNLWTCLVFFPQTLSLINLIFQNTLFKQPQQIQVAASTSVASPTRFPVAERPSPVQPTFFQSFPQLGSFVDPRSSGGGGQRAQRALPEGASVPLEEEVDRQLPTSKFSFPDPEFGGFVPIRKNNEKNRRYWCEEENLLKKKKQFFHPWDGKSDGFFSNWGIFFLKIQNYHQWLWVMKYQPIHSVPFWTIDKEFLKC